MKVLVVSSGNSGDIGILVKNQCESLRKAGVEIENFLINGKGFWGYLINIPKIRKACNESNPTLVHAHYSLSGIAASFLSRKFPLAVSLMGSDTYMSGGLRLIARVFNKVRWDVTIVKTLRMKELLFLKNAYVIPNGVNLEFFRPISNTMARERIGYRKNSRLIVFVANPERPEKNFNLASLAVKELKRPDVELICVYNFDNSIIPYYLNSADLLLLTSKFEGSVNVIKEAMACNIPIVSTDVGDVGWVIKGVEGCYLTSFEVGDITEKIRLALALNGRTTGRERILELGLDSESVANKIKEVYENVLSVKRTKS